MKVEIVTNDSTKKWNIAPVLRTEISNGIYSVVGNDNKAVWKFPVANIICIVETTNE